MKVTQKLILLTCLCFLWPLQTRTARGFYRHLEQRVRAKLEEESDISPNLIKVRAKNGTIELKGAVATLAERQRVIKATKSVPGVNAIKDKMEVLTQYKPDELIKRELRNSLVNSSIVDSRLPTISVKKSVVKLGGTVNTWQIKRQSARLAERIKGVKGVINNIEIANRMQPLSDNQFEAVIKEELAQQEQISAPLVNVTVRRGVAHLSGYVATKREMDLAIAVAENAGVREVVSKSLELQNEVTNKKPWIRLTGYVTSAAQKEQLENTVSALTDARVINGLKVRKSKPVTDEMLQREIENALSNDPYLDSKILVRVRDGVVLLSGQVNNSYEAQRAHKHAASLRGTKAVKNKLSYEATYYYRPDEELSDAISGLLFFSPFIDEKQVSVFVKNGVVTLKGVARSKNEEKRIIRKCFSAHAKDVRSKLELRRERRKGE